MAQIWGYVGGGVLFGGGGSSFWVVWVEIRQQKKHPETGVLLYVSGRACCK